MTQWRPRGISGVVYDMYAVYPMLQLIVDRNQHRMTSDARSLMDHAMVACSTRLCDGFSKASNESRY